MPRPVHHRCILTLAGTSSSSCGWFPPVGDVQCVGMCGGVGRFSLVLADRATPVVFLTVRVVSVAGLGVLDCIAAFATPAISAAGSSTAFLRTPILPTTKPAECSLAARSQISRRNPFRSQNSAAVSMAADPKNVLIVGAGPAGLLAAHHLLRNGEPGAFKVTIAERRSEGYAIAKGHFSLSTGALAGSTYDLALLLARPCKDPS